MNLDDIWQIITEICNKLSFKLFSEVQKNPQNLNIFMKKFRADLRAQMAKLDLDITLSKKLYDVLKNEAVSVIKKHTKESAAALDLAKKLYEGYNFKSDPLKVTKKLPKYLKNEVLKKAEKRALKLKTPALKASYLKALKSRENENFNKNLKVAFYEKARFYAKRIALNESARAYNMAKATEFLNDENVQFVKYKMSHTHPRADICDYFANADLYGLGKGIYPKEKAPLTPCHPFCRCNLIPKYSIKGEANLNKKAVELAQKRYFDNLSLKKQSEILGSYDNLKRFKKGENLLDLINKNRPKEYHIKLLENLKVKKVKSQNGKENYTTRSQEFRELQRASKALNDKELQLYRSGSKTLDKTLRTRFSAIFQREVEHSVSDNGDNASILKNTADFKIYKGINGDLFYDIFKINKNYLKNGELVTLHEKYFYKDTINYLSNDGLSGFAITKKGDLVSVFNLNDKRGFLRAISNEIKANAKTLDCYMSEKQPLAKIYEKAFNFKTASTMNYNMDYDHDNIAKNHNMPKVAFMVNTNKAVTLKHFDKDSYEKAEDYRNSFLEPSKADF